MVFGLRLLAGPQRSPLPKGAETAYGRSIWYLSEQPQRSPLPKGAETNSLVSERAMVNGLNEVRSPKERRPGPPGCKSSRHAGLNEVRSPKERRPDRVRHPCYAGQASTKSAPQRSGDDDDGPREP